MTRVVELTVLMGLVLVVVGCKTTELMVVNDTGQDVQVTLQGPGKILPNPPTLSVVNSGKAVFKIETPDGKLPANYQWQGAGRIGTIVIAKDTPDRVIYNLSTGLETGTKVEVRTGGTATVEVTPDKSDK